MTITHALPAPSAATSYGRARTYRDRAVRILNDAAELFEQQPHRWVRGAMFRDPVSANTLFEREGTASGDVRCCAIGALALCSVPTPRRDYKTITHFESTIEGALALRYADRAAARWSNHWLRSIVRLNDKLAKSAAEVAAVLRQAAADLAKTSPLHATDTVAPRSAL